MRVLPLLIALPVFALYTWTGVLMALSPTRFLRFYDRVFDPGSMTKGWDWRDRVGGWETKIVGVIIALSGLFFLFITATTLLHLTISWP